MDGLSASRLARIAFTYPNFRFYIAARFLVILALEMQAVAVGWQIYALTNRPLDLGLVGLAQFFRAFSCFWPRATQPTAILESASRASAASRSPSAHCCWWA
jgi:hypothetical protein